MLIRVPNNKKKQSLANLKDYVLIAYLDSSDFSSHTITPKKGTSFSVGSNNLSATNPFGSGNSVYHVNGGDTWSFTLPSNIWSGDFVVEYWYNHNSDHVDWWQYEHRAMFASGATSSQYNIIRNVASGTLDGFGVQLMPLTWYSPSVWMHHVIAKKGSQIIGGYHGHLGTVKSVGALSGNFFQCIESGGRDHAAGYISTISIRSGSGVADSWINNNTGVYTVPTKAPGK